MSSCIKIFKCSFRIYYLSFFYYTSNYGNITLWANKIFQCLQKLDNNSYVFFITLMAANHFILLTWMNGRIHFLGEEKLFLYSLGFCNWARQIKLTGDKCLFHMYMGVKKQRSWLVKLFKLKAYIHIYFSGEGMGSKERFP